MSLIQRIKKKLSCRGRKLSISSAIGMPDKVFLSLFNVKAVVELIEQNDIQAAKAALIHHYRHRKTPAWIVAPKTITDLRVNTEELDYQALIELAESILEYRFAPDGSLPKIVNNQIEWRFNPISSKEWLWRLNRHQWWPILGLAYKRTGDERYAQAFVEQMTDWIQQNPLNFIKNENSPTWRLMETGMRMYISWVPSFAMFFESPCFDEDDKIRMLRSIYDHASFLFHFSTNRNHLLRETNGLIAVCISFPEFKDVERWKQEALTRIEREISKQINDDGSHIEVSTGYQWLVVDELERTFDLITSGKLSLPNQDMGRCVEKMYSVLARVVRPDGSFPEINDGFMRWSSTRLAEAGKKFRRPDLRYVGTSGQEGEAPETTSVNIGDAGWVVMRSDWTDQARYLLFDTGPFGGPHGHEDKLSIEVFAFGRSFIVDSGSYTYEAADPFRSYFVGTASHNSILVDGKSQIRRWTKSNLTPNNVSQKNAHWICRREFDYAISEYSDGYSDYALRKPKNPKIIGDVLHTRSVLFVKPDYWILIDKLQAKSPHDYQLLFHARPGLATQVLPEKRVCLEDDTSFSKLLIIPIEPESLDVELISGSTEPIQGWFSVDHHKKIPSTAICYERMQASSTMMATLLLPLSENGLYENQAVAVNSYELESGDGYAFTIKGTHGNDYIVVSDCERPKRIGSFETKEMVSVIRKKTGELNPWGLARA